MKKLLIAAIVAVAAGGGGIVGYHQAQRASHQELSALMLANVEALSQTESTIANCDDGCSTDNYGNFCCTIVIKGVTFTLRYPQVKQ